MPLPQQVASVTQAFLAAIDARSPGLVHGLYLHGSLGFGEYFPGRSDVDFVAILPARPDHTALAALIAAHAEVRAAFPQPPFEGIYLLRADLSLPPADCPDVPYFSEATFHPAGRFELDPVTWHELARHGISVRGPELTAADVWTDDAVLRSFTHANVSSYWAGIAAQLRSRAPQDLPPDATSWCVLGVSRLHHLLATGSMTSKSGAGRHALATFGERWHPIIREALRLRERPDQPSAYAADPAARGRDTTTFTTMAMHSALTLHP